MSNLHKQREPIQAIHTHANWIMAVVITVGLWAVPGPVNAQDSGATLEEIVVTSRRYEESINDAPLAVNVLDAEYLQKQGVNTLSDALQLTPGATWGHYTMAQPGHTLRGIESYNSGNASLESSVQMVVDGIPITQAFMMTPPVFDLERIEVMRGPQGTTFGRNASLGIAHFVTAKPSQEFRR
jgi:outer membrane receptor for ferrienterochelin and colicin